MRTHLAVAVLVICAVLTGLGQEKVLIKYKMDKGKVFLYEDVVDGKGTQEMMGQEMKSTQYSRSINRWAIENVLADGSIVVVMSADSMVTRVKNQRMDTTITPKEMIGKRRKVVLTPRGVVTERAVIDSVNIEGMRGMAGRDGGRYHQFSPDPVAVGGKWTASILDTVESMGGKMYNAATMEYTLTGKEQKLGHECLKITYAGTTTTNGKGAMRGMEVFMEGSGKTAGTVYWDPSGYSVYEEATVDMDMNLAITGQQAMTIPTTSSNKITKTLLKN
jgi:hypothetical protein